MPRGRSYPAASLRDAINRARDLYDKDKRAYVPTDMAVRAWGYTSLNGRSLRQLSALRQYGLLDDGPDKTVRVSDRALAILVEPPGSEDRRAALEAAANGPAIFQEILDQYDGDLPSDDVLIAYLVRREGFSPDAAGRLVATLRDTLSLVWGNSESYNGGEDSGEDGDGEDKSDRPFRTPKERKAPPPGGRMEFSWPLSDNAVATLTVSRELDLEDVETLTDYFKIAERTLRKAATERATAGSEPKPD